MRNIFAVAVCALMVATASASVLWSETFESYNTGDLVPQGDWAAHSGTGTFVQVNDTANGPTFPGTKSVSLNFGSGSRQDVNHDLGATLGAGETWYAGFDVNISVLPTAADYFAHFLQGTSSFVGKVGVAPTTDGFQFTLANGSGSTVTHTYPDTFVADTWYRVVVAYSFDDKMTTLWVNPIDANSTNVGGISTLAQTAATAFALRQGGNAAGSQIVDNIIVGTDFASVVPEPSSVLLLGLGLAGLIRRR